MRFNDFDMRDFEVFANNSKDLEDLSLFYLAKVAHVLNRVFYTICLASDVMSSMRSVGIKTLLEVGRPAVSPRIENSLYIEVPGSGW